MTHSIISLGQRAALSALLLRASCPGMDSASGFSEGHFDPLIPLRVKSSAGWRHLIFNDLEALQVESGGHFGQLIFTEWAYRITGKTEVLKMITPVASLRLKSSYGKRNLILDDSPNSHCGGFGSERLGVTVKWYFPKWEAPLYRIEATFALRWR